MPSDTSNRDPVEILGEEFLARRRRGENPQIHQYMKEHRQYADQISALFPAMIAMEDLKKLKSQSSDRPIRLHVDRLERLGDYRIVREIGHGGMGIVYEAEQQSLHRRVAVKVFPKQAFDDSSQLKRFQREAETAGRLHHTNIVPVFGVGQQDGMHYFVMQYIDGVSIDQVIENLRPLLGAVPHGELIGHVVTQQRSALQAMAETPAERHDPLAETGTESSDDYCEITSDHVVDAPTGGKTKRFGRSHWRQIAEVGTQVADALRCAHEAGVLHRDIKPSNLILDADLRVWVTDFGLAVTHEQERLSRSGDVVGTLRYMSPEQLNGKSDPRSDIYGLGLTLYELATLQPAFEGENRGSLIRKVSQCTPPPPRSICRDIPRDLETIILKAISREPSSRYRNAAEFADDLRRFCEDRPIAARRISPMERIARWSRRNPALAGMSMALTLGAIVSFVAVSWNWRQAIEEKRNAVAEGERAENNMTLALGSMDRLLERFESDWMSHPVAPDTTDGESDPQFRFVVSDHSAAVLEEALEFYDRFAQQNASSPKLVRETAKANRRAGDILERLGRYEDAKKAYQRSVDLMVQEIDRKDGDETLTAETASVLNRLAMLLHREFRSREAKTALDHARFLLSNQVSQNSSSVDCMFELAQTNSNLGLVLWRLRLGEESTDRHRNAILLLQGLVEDQPYEPKYRLALANAYQNYHAIAAVCNEQVYATEIRNSSERILERLVADFPEVPDYRCELSELLLLAAQSDDLGSHARLDQADRAVKLAYQLNRDFPTIPRYQVALARALSRQATLLREDEPDLADALHGRSVDMLNQLATRFPNVVAYRVFLANALRQHGLTLQSMERLEDAARVFQLAVDQNNAFLQSHPESPLGRRELANDLQLLAETLEKSGDTERAGELSEEATRFWRKRPAFE